MGVNKRQFEEDESQRAEAVQIAREAGAIVVCRHETEIDNGDEEAGAALARKVWEERGFTSAKDAEEHVRRVIREAAQECGHEDCNSSDAEADSDDPPGDDD